MKALRWKSGTLELVETDKPCDPAPGHVIIRMAFCGVCGTDIHIMAKEFSARDGVIMGHEMSGVVAELGQGVDTLTVGEKVTIDPNTHCGSCMFCQRTLPNQCKTGSLKSTFGIFRDGGWAEYVVVPASVVASLPKGLALKEAVLAEPLSCVLRGLYRNGAIPADRRVLVIGAGIIGLLWGHVLYRHGYRDLTISEPVHSRQKMAENLGFKVCHPNELSDKYSDPEVANNEGFDLVVDCSGNPKAVAAAIGWMRRGGTLNLFGLSPPSAKIPLPAQDMVIKELTIVTTIINSWAWQPAVCMLADMVKEGLDLDKLGINIYPLHQYEQAFNDLKECKISKAIFEIAGNTE